MLEAEARMREALARRTLGDIDAEVAGKLSDGFMRRTASWFDDRNVNRRARAGRRGRGGGCFSLPARAGGVWASSGATPCPTGAPSASPTGARPTR